jgi:hypothetical protein
MGLYKYVFNAGKDAVVNNRFIIMTTINSPGKTVQGLVEMCSDWKILVVGDKKTPNNWYFNGVNFIPYEQQLLIESEFVRLCPSNHYCRKNIGYLLAFQHNAQVIAETDDDNIPVKNTYLKNVSLSVLAEKPEISGWVNVYQYFTGLHIWPRGFPLEHLNACFSELTGPLPLQTVSAPIQQFLADLNPDVDAVYRLTNAMGVHFDERWISLGVDTYCPFNSQNTLWWPEAYPLMYLPGFVSFRMTDIWRSFIATRCLHAAGKTIVFGPATMLQERNDHNLLKDFEQEIPGYLLNDKIVNLLEKLTLSPTNMRENLLASYEALVAAKFIPPEELILVNLWVKELEIID